MTTPSFTRDPIENCIFWGSVRLDDQACEAILDVFDNAGAAATFNELYALHLACGGIERVSSLRAA